MQARTRSHRQLQMRSLKGASWPSCQHASSAAALADFRSRSPSWRGQPGANLRGNPPCACSTPLRGRAPRRPSCAAAPTHAACPHASPLRPRPASRSAPCPGSGSAPGLLRLRPRPRLRLRPQLAKLVTVSVAPRALPATHASPSLTRCGAVVQQLSNNKVPPLHTEYLVRTPCC